jgi:hypothetical protein
MNDKSTNRKIAGSRDESIMIRTTAGFETSCI